MNTLFTHTKKTIPARFLAAVTMVAMILSAFPASFFVANAQELPNDEEVLEEGVKPILECWVDNGDDTGIAYFGYENENDSAVNIPVGEDNKFNGPNAPDEGQTTEFQPGRTDYVDDAGVFKPGNAAFSVEFPLSGEKVWTLTGPDGDTRTATAGTNGPKCPEPEPTGEIRVCKLIIDENGDLTDGAGYDEDFTITLDLDDADFETTVDFSTALTLDTDLVTDNGDAYDAECVLVENLAPGNYYYGEEALDVEVWEDPLYHDNHNEDSDELADFGTLAPEGTPGEKNNDGSIRLEADETRTLAVLNTRVEPEVPELEIPERCSAVVDEFTVPADSGAGTDTSFSLDAGRNYFAVVAGTYTFGAPKNGDERLADAEYSLEAGDTEWSKEFSAAKPDVLDLFIDGNNPDFGTFRADHTYGTLFSGTGAPANFAIQDDPYRDNDGSLDVTLYECEPVEVPACEIGENLLDNGSFEEPVIKNGWKYTAITDWMITALDDGATQDGELHRGWSGNQAAHGEQYAELDSRESIKLAQTVDTVEGATYELKWAFAPRHNIDATENQLSVQVDGDEVATEGPASGSAGLTPGDWTRNTHTFKADGSSVEIAFADAGVTSDSLGTFLDDAALCFVRDPEPTPEEPDICSDSGEVVSAEQGLTNGGDAVDADRSDTSNAADGVASYNNWGAKEPSWSTNDFYSLGIGGHLVYEFTDKIALDQAGADIAVWEITGGNNGVSNESAKVYLSENGVDFELAGTVTGDGTVDIADTSLSFVKYVKLVDDSAGVQGNSGDGFDVDAITIIEGSCDDYAMVHTTKVVCEDESELPNWNTDQNGAPKIDADTLTTDWVLEDHPSCEIVDDWEFEWAPKSASDPGDTLVGPAGSDWHTFTGSTVVPASAFEDENQFWMREVLKDGFIPFTHEAEGNENTDDQTAEFYCHTDGRNYDNYDRIDNPEAGGEYHCMGWNVPAEPEQCTLDIYSDEMTLVEDTNELAVATYDGNDNWTADIPGATWIWASEEVEDPETDETHTFVETFEVDNPTKADITIAHDNWLVFSVNGVEIDDRTGVNGYQDYQKQTYDILDEVVPGENRIEFVVTNEGKDGDNSLQNPAGLLFHLSAEGDADSCERTTDRTPEEEKYLIDGYKYEVREDLFDYEYEYESLSLPSNTRAGWEIELLDGEGDVIDATTTDSNGYYYFHVPAGDYEVREIMQTDWTQIGVQDGEDYIYPDGEPHTCVFTLPMEYDATDYDSDYRCDFYNEFRGENEDEEEEDNGDDGDGNVVQTFTRSSGGSTGTRVDRRAEPQPLVAGAADSQCRFLEDHMQMGIVNDRFEVMKLQMFLQMIMGYEQPVTGFFGATTDANVKRFQEEYRSEVLDPWYERGIVPHNRPTGFVYKTTKWKINDIVCPDLEEYPSFEGETLDENVDIDATPIPD